jgi:DNA polymerase III subunit delta
MSDTATIEREILSGKPKPVYLLHGEEAFFIDQLVTLFEEKLIPEQARAFDLTIFYGRDAKIEQIKDTLVRYPVLSDHQLVVIREAQSLDKLDELATYVSNPVSTTVLVIAHRNKKVDARKQLAKQVKEHGVLFESKPLYDNQIPGWIAKQGAHYGIIINQEIASYMAEHLGNDLSKIHNELQKLLLNIEPGKTVQKADVEKYIGISKEYNFFEFQKQLSTGSVTGIMQIGMHIANNDKAFNMVQLIAMLFTYFQKVYKMHAVKHQSERDIMSTLGLSSPYFIGEYKSASQIYSRAKLEEIFQTLRLYDQRSKGFGAIGLNNHALFKELLLKILP